MKNKLLRLLLASITLMLCSHQVFAIEISTETTVSWTLNNGTITDAPTYTGNTANDYMVTLSPAPTIVNGIKKYENGTEVSLTANSNKILTFANWDDNTTASEKKIVMNQNQHVTATYSALDYMVGWDFYKTGKQDRPADFADASNTTATLTMRDADGNSSGWLDKSFAQGGYDGRNAAVNWQSVIGKYYWQTKVNAADYKNIKVCSSMYFKYKAYHTYRLQFSTNNGETWTTAGTFHLTQGVWQDQDITLPAEANNKQSLYIRWIADQESEASGDGDTNDGISMADIYIYGTKAVVNDGNAPVLVSSIPTNGATGASASGKMIVNMPVSTSSARTETPLPIRQSLPIRRQKQAVTQYVQPMRWAA